MVSLVVLVGAKVANTTEFNNTCQQGMLFSFLFFFPYFNEYFHIHVWKLLQLYGYLIYGQVASNQAQPISEFGFVSRRMNRKKQGRNWVGNIVLSSNPRGPKHLHQYNPFFFFQLHLYFDYKCHRYETFTYLFVFHRFCCFFFCPDCFTFLTSLSFKKIGELALQPLYKTQVDF